MRPPFSIAVVLRIRSRIIAASGGSTGVRDIGILASSLAAPFQTFGGVDLIPGIAQKAAALAFGIIRSHPFVDGNKRTAYVLMKTLLVDHRLRLTATEDERENALVAVADGSGSAQRFTGWLEANVSKAS